MSTIPAVKAALVSLLTTALPDTQVIYGPADSVTTTKSRILTVGKVIGDRQLNSMTNVTTGERYIVDLVASVSLAGTSQQAADELVLADYAAAELAIREYSGGSDLGLSAQGVQQVLPTGNFELAEQSDAEGRYADVRFSVAVIAQNT